MADEQEVSAGFPIAGLNLTCEFGRQPTDTTPDSQNVRSYEVLLQRVRGGIRPGLSRYIDEQVVGSNLIQNLCVLVDPQAPGLRSDFDPRFPDPSTNNLRTRVPPGRMIRIGGSGIDPVGNDDASQDTSPIAFVQKKREQPGNFQGITYDLTLDTLPGMNHMVIVIVRTNTLTGSSELVDSVTNGAGDLYSQVGGPGYTSDVQIPAPFTGTNSLSTFYRIVQGIEDDITVRVTRGSPQFAIYEIAALVYRNQAQAGPLSSFSRLSVPTPGLTTQPAGIVAMNNTDGQMCLAVWTQANASYELTPETTELGYNPRFGLNIGGLPGPVADFANICVADRLGISGATPQQPAVVVTAGGDKEYASMITAWTK